MQDKNGPATPGAGEIHLLIEDFSELTPKEFAQERKAAMEEHQRKAWLGHSPAQLAGRIPVSVFALGDHVAKA